MTRLMNEFEYDLSPVVLSYILIRCNYKYQPNFDMIQVAVQTLNVIMNCYIFKDKSKPSIIIRRSIYNLLKLIQLREWESCCQKAYYRCLSQVLTDTETAEHYWQEQENEESEIPREKWFFPFNMENYCLVATGLANASEKSFEKVIEESYKLPIICLPFSEEIHHYLHSESGVLRFTQDYYPLNNVKISSGSVCTIESSDNPKTIHIQTELNYWTVLSNLITICINNLQEGRPAPFDEIVSSFQFWLTILNNIQNTALLTNDIVSPVDNIFELFGEMLLKRVTNTEVFAVGLEIITTISKLTESDDICKKLRHLSLFPVLIDSNLPVEKIIKPNNFVQGRIFELILDYDLIYNRYDLLKAYLKFLRVRFEQKAEDYNTFEIPGIIFILQDILPKFSEWTIDIGSSEQDILYDSIFLIFNILREPIDKKNTLFQVLQKICIFDLLHVTNGKVVLNIVARGYRYLEILMQSETNWISGPCVQYLHIVQMSLTILMLLFQKKPLIAKHDTDMPLEVLMFTQPKEEDTLQIIRNIASYMDHIFNKQLPVLACRILRKFALKLQISLHGCFDMDSDQIRHVFIHRLRDKEESDDLKIAILDFIIACVQKQPGLTQTFFSKASSSSDSNNDDDSLLSLMEEFLDLMSSETEVLNNPIFRSMMSLFHELWKSQKQVVVSVMRNNKTFWDKLCSPLKFKRIIPSLNRSYSQILNIISLELYMSTNDVNSNLKSVLNIILDPSQEYLSRWIEYIFNENDLDDKIDEIDLDTFIPNWLSLLQSWKDFLTILISRMEISINPTARSMLGHACLSALVRELDRMDDSRIVTVLSGIYVFILNHWKDDVFDDRSETIALLSRIVILTHNSHRTWHKRIRIAILSTTVYCIKYLKMEIRCDSDISMKIFNSACKLACDELNLLEMQYQPEKKNNMDTQDPMKLNDVQETILKLNLLNEVLIVCDDMTDLYRSCVHMKLCLRLVQCLQSIVHYKAQRPITLAILDCIIHLIQTQYADEFLSCDLGLNLWIKCLPPKELLKKDRDPFNEILWKKEEWWPLYQRIILIVGFLLRKLESRFLEDALSFIVIHDTYLVECICAVRHSIDLATLNMVDSTVTFIYEIMKYQKQWKPYHIDSYLQILKALQSSLYCSVAYLLRPNYIKYAVDKSKSNEKWKPDMEDSLPSNEVLEVINKLIDIITRICQVLLKQAPSLMSLLCNHCSFIEPCTLILELDFTTPTLSNEEDLDLSFGAILSAINLFARSLQYNQKTDSRSLRKSNSPLEARPQLSPRKRIVSYSSDTVGTKLNTSISSELVELFSASPTTGFNSKISQLRYLNKIKSSQALEVLLTLLATQTLIYLLDMQEPKTNRQKISREINSELNVFHEYVKRINRISRVKLGSTPVVTEKYDSIEPRNFTKSSYLNEVNPYTMESITFEERFFREKIAEVHFKRDQELDGCKSDGDPIPILTTVTFNFPDYFIFLSNLFASICKQEDV